MTDEQLRDIYLKATGLDLNAVGENKRGYEQGHAFVKALFDALPVAGYLDPDGTMYLEEWEASADCVEVFRRPE